MGTRFYPMSNYAPAVTPSSWSAGWNKTSGTSTLRLNLSPNYNPNGSNITNGASGTSGHFTASFRAVSQPLYAQTIAGTLKGQFRCDEPNATDNFTLAVAVKVVKSDGSDRGVLLAVSASDDTSATPPEMALSALTNRKLLDSAESANLTLSSLDVGDGDCLVVEIGFRQASTSTASGVVAIDVASTTDLPEDNTTTAANNAWVEFSQNILFKPAIVKAVSNPADSAVATNTADPTAVVPSTQLQAGDLVLMIGHQRATGATLAVSQAGGQTWTSETAIGTTLVTARLFWCTFNGTWSADPSVDFSATVCNSVVLFGFRALPGYVWAIDKAQVELDIAAAPHTITGQTTIDAPTITFAGWFTADDNTWGSLTSGWEVCGEAQYRNTSGSDHSMTFAFREQDAGAATGNVTKTQLTLGDDASTTLIVTFKAILNKAPPTIVNQAINRAAGF